MKKEGSMPIYEYRCQNCEWLFEKLSKMQESEGLTKCPHCGEKKAERVLSGFCCSKSSEPLSSSCGPAGKSKRFS